jgi:hypothetical protein
MGEEPVERGRHIRAACRVHRAGKIHGAGRGGTGGGADGNESDEQQNDRDEQATAHERRLYRGPRSATMAPMTEESHWVRWHHAYDSPDSPLRYRLAVVQQAVRDALDAAPPGRVRIGSLCAGRGLDVIDVLAEHPRAADVRACLVELDPVLAADGARAAAALAHGQVEVLARDASTTDALAGIVPVDVLLLCGIFGNVSETDIRRTVQLTPTLLAPGATVIWTRHRRPPDLTPTICEWFAEAGFTERSVHTPDPNGVIGVAVHRLAADPAPFRPGQRLFTFVGDGSAG